MDKIKFIKEQISKTIWDINYYIEKLEAAELTKTMWEEALPEQVDPNEERDNNENR